MSPLFRRREPLHERLARWGGLREHPLPEIRPPGWMETGIHGVQRAREWDGVFTVEVGDVPANEAEFVVLPDGSLHAATRTAAPLVEELRGSVEPPYSARAVRRGPHRWVVGVRRISVVELEQDPGGDEVTLTVNDGERILLVDGSREFGSIPALERLGAGHGDSYVVQASRLEGALWETRVVPL